MGTRRLAIRIVGVAATARGFAFAVTEGPERLIDFGGHKTCSRTRLLYELDLVIKRARPLFVVCEIARNSTKSERGRTFNEALKVVCARYGIMILCAMRRRVMRQGRESNATNYEVALTVVDRYRVLADKLPKPRKHWDAPKERVGVLLAAAVAAAGWDHFRTGAKS